MLEFFDVFRGMDQLALALRLGLAVLCGGLIGLEREIKHRAAGFRTHILICMGAAITTLTSQYLYLSGDYFTDPARLGAQVIAGIGFIGAGAIIVTKQSRIKGLTTAAGLWVSALIGLACGAGFVECTIIATAIVLIAELLLVKLETKIAGNIRDQRYYIEYSGAMDLNDILDELRKGRIRVLDMELSVTNSELKTRCAIMTLRPLNISAGKKIHLLLSQSEKVLNAEQL